MAVTRTTSPVKGDPTDPLDEQYVFPSIVAVKAAIPGHLFESTLTTSLYYVAKDLVLISSLYAAVVMLEPVLPTCAMCVVFPCFWYLQGTMFMALFVLGHDCGHGSFSKYSLLNDTLGTLLHTVVLTPYYQWKLSHKNHHKNTGNIDKDEVFYPIRQVYHNGRGFVFLFGLGLGWFLYLFRGYHPRKINHFNLFEKMFASHMTGCALSMAAQLGILYCLYLCACSIGILGLLKYYVMPELVFASWLLIVTFLHHTEEDTPWYSDEHWNYVKGQLSSVDRHYGWAHELIHNIGTHQVHHLFIRVPHYHLEEATRHFRQAFPHLVRKRDDPIIPSMFRMFRKFTAQYVIRNDAKMHIFK